MNNANQFLNNLALEDDNKEQLRSSFDTMIQDKIVNFLEIKKVELASSMIDEVAVEESYSGFPIFKTHVQRVLNSMTHVSRGESGGNAAVVSVARIRSKYGEQYANEVEKEAFSRYRDLGMETRRSHGQQLGFNKEVVERKSRTESISEAMDITAALKSKDYYNRMAAIEHYKATGKHITTALKDKHVEVRYAAIQHPNVTTKHITAALKDKHPLVRAMAVENKKATTEHITTALKDKSSDVRYTAIFHDKATKDHINTALKDKDGDVRKMAIQHSNVTSEHINTALNDESVHVRRMAIQHRNVTPDHITTAMKDEDRDVREKAIGQPKATVGQITTALKDKSEYVRAVAIQHHKATPEHITTALKDESSYVRIGAANHPNATPEHITTALKDRDEDVRERAVDNPNATSAHVATAMKDDSGAVRQTAYLVGRVRFRKRSKISISNESYNGEDMNKKTTDKKALDELLQAGSAPSSNRSQPNPRNILTNIRRATQVLKLKGINPQRASQAHLDFSKLVAKNPKAPGYMLLRKLAPQKAAAVQQLTQAGVPLGRSLEANPAEFNQVLQRIKRFK